jgi:hypothetical protein
MQVLTQRPGGRTAPLVQLDHTHRQWQGYVHSATHKNIRGKEQVSVNRARAGHTPPQVLRTAQRAPPTAQLVRVRQHAVFARRGIILMGRCVPVAQPGRFLRAGLRSVNFVRLGHIQLRAHLPAPAAVQAPSQAEVQHPAQTAMLENSQVKELARAVCVRLGLIRTRQGRRAAPCAKQERIRVSKDRPVVSHVELGIFRTRQGR